MDFNFKKATQSLESLPFQDRLKAVGNLVKNSITIIGRDKDIVKPWTRMIVYNAVMVSCFFYAWLGWWYELPAEGWALFLSIVLFLYKHFYHNRQEMRMSWTVYETVIGNDPTYKEAKTRGREVKSQTRKIAWV